MQGGIKFMKSRLPVLFLIATFLLSSGKVGGVENLQPVGQNQGTDISSFESSAAAINDFMTAAVTSGLDWRRCNLSTRMGDSNFQRFDLELYGDKLEAMKRFFEEVQKQKQLTIMELQGKPNYRREIASSTIQFNLTMALYPGGSSKSLDELLKPLDELDFFSPDASPQIDKAQLFSFHFVENKGTRFQVVGAKLSDLADLTKRPGLPGRSKTISKSRFGDADLFNLDFSHDNSFPSTSVLLEKFNQLSQISDIREITLDTDNRSEKVAIARLLMQPENLEKLADIFSSREGWLPLEADISGTPDKPAKASPSLDESWTFTFTMRPQDRPDKFDAGEIKNTLSAAWPPAIRDLLKIHWTSKKISISIEFPSTPEMSSQELLKSTQSIADSLGYNPEGSRNLKDNLTGETQVRYSFGKNLSAAGQPNPAEGGKALKEIFSKAEILENVQTSTGQKYSLRLPFSEVGNILKTLLLLDKKGVSEFSLSCRNPEPAQVTFVQTDDKDSQARDFSKFLLSLCGNGVPWNLPEDSVKTGVVVQGMSISSDGRFEIVGITLKSRLIFSSLFPLLKKLPLEGEPFFSEGNYRDHSLGRLMTFKVTGKGPGWK